MTTEQTYANLPDSDERERTILGFTQRAILTSLTQENRTVAHVHYDWHWISESAARSAMQRLYRRGLVDVAGFEGSARTYGITCKGLEALDGNLVDSDA